MPANDQRLTVLAVGATGSIGSHVVDEALASGHRVRALVRAPGKLAGRSGVEVVVADLTEPRSLHAAVEAVDAIVFTHGTYGSPRDAERVDYGGVRNVLAALAGRQVRIALMTAIAVTDRKGAHDWKRRAERLVRVSGHPYTIVRSGWFDANEPDQLHLRFLQGDTRQSGTPRDGAVARREIARVLVRSLTSRAAPRKTFELVAETGPERRDLDPLFAALDADAIGAVDAARDAANMALEAEPASVVADLEGLRAVPGTKECLP
jgi:uncharacterized protein YbjT (DUF2867 family)